MNFKNTLRKEINKKLSSLSEKDKQKKSNLITQNITSLDHWNSSKKVFLYINFRKEVITKDLIKIAKENNKEVYAPIIDGQLMSFFRIDNLNDSDFVINKFGIKEPPLGLDEVVPDKQSLMLIPGVAFTTKGERLGRGGGFYDRYLSNYTDIIKVAVAFDMQLCNHIPTESWDQRIDYLITEKEIYKIEE